MAPIRMAIIGCGAIVASQHLDKLVASTEVEIVGFADPSPKAVATLRKRSKKLAKAPEFREHREVLDAVSPNAVLIASPHTLHFQQILDAFDAGCDVLTEKPMVCTADHARQVLARRDEAGKVLLVAYQRHYLPAHLYVKEAIASGELGEIRFVSALQSQGWLKGTRGKWRQDPKLSGGGQLLDSGSHLLDFVLHATGLQAASAMAYEDRLGAPVDINTALNVRFRSGAIASLAIVGGAPKGMWEDVSFFGSRGAIMMRTTLERGLSHPLILREDGSGPPEEVTDLPEGSHPLTNFVDAVMGRDTVRSPGEGALAVVELTEAAWRSAATGKEARIG